MILRVWTLGTQLAPICGASSVPCVTEGWGVTLREIPEWPICWGWTAPGQYAAADRYGRRLVADVELKSWTGAELDHAAALAARVGGVTSHGYVAPALRKALQTFAAAGATAYPQIYDTDRSTPPTGAFARACVTSYRNAGFVTVAPLLGLSAGRERVTAWALEAAAMGVQEIHLWQRGQVPAACQWLADLPGGGGGGGGGGSGGGSGGLAVALGLGLGLGALYLAGRRGR